MCGPGLGRESPTSSECHLHTVPEASCPFRPVIGPSRRASPTAARLRSRSPPPHCSSRAARARPRRRSGADVESAVDESAAFPLTIDNCGTETTFEASPQRVVTIKSSTLELLLALGLEDRIVGTAFSDGPVPDEYADAASELEVLSDKVPSQEVTLAAEPDLVFAGWESNLSAEGAGDRAALDQLGVATYVAPAACKGEGYMPDPLTFDEVFREFEEAGAIFGVPDAAADLVADQRAALEAVEPNDDGLTALWYTSGDDTPFVGAGIGAPQMIMDAAGLENVAADVRRHVDVHGLGGDRRRRSRRDRAGRRAVEHRRVEDRETRGERRDGGAARRAGSSATWSSTSRRPRRACGTSARSRRSSISSESWVTDVPNRRGSSRGRRPRPGVRPPTEPGRGRLRPARPSAPLDATGLRTGAWAVGLAVLLAASVVVAVTIGPAGLSPADVWASVLAHLGIGEPTLSPLRDGIVWQLRMPRVLTAAAVGAGLALCGAVMQALTRNPLADPYLLGLSSGASVGAVVVIVLGVALVLPLAAFAGALAALVATLALANAAGALTPTRTVLAGLAVSVGVRRDHEPRHLLERDG